ncbi:hypothetical protein [Nocardia abscessus]|uniref:hypothetical protein n=1 Tax=Nocardia abscessus TaxID=120957 RepID=UPI002455ECD3|nr:hypothetical protein [Nocardia abscessus]
MSDNNCQINGRSVFSDATVGEVVMYVGHDPRYLGGRFAVTGYDAHTRTYAITFLHDPTVKVPAVSLRDLRFLNERVPAPETKEPDSQAPDNDYVTAGTTALTDGRASAMQTAEFWRRVAATLTELRAFGGAEGNRPELPCSWEEWYETSRPALPFDLEELFSELEGLSPLITKAYTIASIYADRAEYLEQQAKEFAAEWAEASGKAE